MIVIPLKKNTTQHKISTMAKTIKNQTPSEASPSKGRKTSTSIVTPLKKVKMGKSKIAVKTQFRKTASSLSNRQLSPSSPSFVLSSLPPSSSPSLPSLPARLPKTMAQLCSNQTTPTMKKKKDAYMPPGLLPKLSLRLKTDNFEVLSKIKLQHYEIDWFNPEVICSECIKYLKSKDSLPNNHASQLKFLMETLNRQKLRSHSRMQLARLVTQLPSYIIHCQCVKIRLYRVLFN